MKYLNEWFYTAPWGKIALVAWGNPDGEPVLLVHGRKDSVATFIPLLELLPDKYHYVGFDMPGDGKSDPFPFGVMLMRFHFLVAVDFVVKHLGWNKFVYLTHSMGSELGLHYNAIYPNKIAKLIMIDSITVLQMMQIRNRGFQEYFETFYEPYFKKYHELRQPKLYSRRRALEAVMKARELNEEQAELVVSRSLKKVGEDQYELCWDRRMAYPGSMDLPNELYLQLFANPPPTLMITAQSSLDLLKNNAGTMELYNALKKHKNVVTKVVDGPHNLHFTDPKEIAGLIIEFLKRDFVASKL